MKKPAKTDFGMKGLRGFGARCFLHWLGNDVNRGYCSFDLKCSLWCLCTNTWEACLLEELLAGNRWACTDAKQFKWVGKALSANLNSFCDLHDISWPKVICEETRIVRDAASEDETSDVTRVRGAPSGQTESSETRDRTKCYVWLAFMTFVTFSSFLVKHCVVIFQIWGLLALGL